MQVITDIEFHSRIASAIRAEIARHGKRQIDLAPVLNVSKPTVYRLLRGKHPFRVDQLQRIAEWLGIDIQVIFDSAELGARVSEKAAA